MAEIIGIRLTLGPKCDFCGVMNSNAWMYDCEPFSVEVPPGITIEFEPLWAACNTCSELVEDGDSWHILALKAAKKFEMDTGYPVKEFMMPIVMTEFEMFRTHRKGERVRYGKP